MSAALLMAAVTALAGDGQAMTEGSLIFTAAEAEACAPQLRVLRRVKANTSGNPETYAATVRSFEHSFINCLTAERRALRSEQEAERRAEAQRSATVDDKLIDPVPEPAAARPSEPDSDPVEPQRPAASTRSDDQVKAKRAARTERTREPRRATTVAVPSSTSTPPAVDLQHQAGAQAPAAMPAPQTQDAALPSAVTSAFLILILIVLGAIPPTAMAVRIYGRLRAERDRNKRFARIVSIEDELRVLGEKADRIRSDAAQAQHKENELRTSIAALEAELKALQDSLQVATQAAEGEMALVEVGHYEPRFRFASATEYKDRLARLEADQARLIKAGKAAVCDTEWVVQGSRAEGRKISERVMKLMLRAFNGEADALIAKVRYDNVVTYSERLRKSFDQINKLTASFNCRLTTDYLDLKTQELYLVYEYQEQVQKEREEQRQIREQMREEERVQKEIAKAQRDAELEEARYQTLLEKARRDAAAAEGEARQVLLRQMADLERELAEAHERGERAKSQAQLTRAGHVYVLSNIGSFGETTFKVGMTRRLDPQERVDELGDASVPFPFDVHAMIYATDAPKLERALHELLHRHRVNRVNPRKEFFRVAIEEVEALVRQHHGEFRLTRQAEAVEYRKTLAMLSAGQEALRLGSDAAVKMVVARSATAAPEPDQN
jgi:hypothetical protein